MSQMRDVQASQRENHIRKFDIEHDPRHEKIHITYEGPIICSISLHDCGLPPGFQQRLAAHVMDLLTGRRTALWDEQAIYGEHPRDPAHARINGFRMADHLAKGRP